MQDSDGLDGAFNNLRAVKDAKDPRLDVIVTSEGVDGEPVGHRLLLSREPYEEFLAVAKETSVRLCDKEPLAYLPGLALGDGQLMYLSTDRAATLEAVQSVVDGGDVDNYNPRAEYVNKLGVLAATVAPTKETRITFYRRFEPSFRLERSKKLALVFSDGRYDRLREEVLLFDRRFDAVVTSGIAMFTSKYTFEVAFGFLEELRLHAAAAFKTVTKGLRIKGMDDFEAACTSQPAMLAKMASIQRKVDEDPGYVESMSMPRIVAWVEEHPECGIEVEGLGDDAELVFRKDASHRFKILRLLDDDHVRSQLTNWTYESNSKSPTGH